MSKGSYDAVSSVFGELQAVCAGLFKIRKVAQTKISNPQRYLYETYDSSMPLKHLIQTHPRVYITILEDLHYTTQMYTISL